MRAADREDVWDVNRTAHLMGTWAETPAHRWSTETAERVPNLFICDGSVFPTSGAMNPSLTIQAIAARTADRIQAMAASGGL
jgi:choline dehydrogenase-like flavoprotein